MSAVQQSIVESPMLLNAQRHEFEGDDFSYRPMPATVPISMAFTVLSGLALMSDLLLIVPLIGIVIAFVAYFQVSRSRGNLSGGGLAIGSLVVMLAMFLGFGTMHVHAYTTEVPEGFTRINFTSDISLKGLQTVGNQIGVHPDVAKLADKPIYLKGYMYPFRETHGLKSFVLCKDMGECCFGGQPKPTDMILINMVDGKSVNYQDKRLVGVAGTLRVEPKLDETGLTPVYQLDCKHFAPAKTWY